MNYQSIAKVMNIEADRLSQKADQLRQAASSLFPYQPKIKRVISAAGRLRIAHAQKLRWARIRREKKALLLLPFKKPSRRAA